jgi:phage/plasmid-like protein (TIGR03299 family)
MAYSAKTGVPWHGLGVALSDGVGTEEMISAAGLRWTTRTVELRTVEGDAVPNRRAVVRDGDIPVGAARVLGVVSDGYVPVPNEEILSFVDGLVADGVVSWDTAGSLKGGRVVWGLARMNEDWRVGDDVHKTYIAVTAGHDGGLAIAAMPTDVRVVCANTHRLAFGANADNATIRVRHSGNVGDKMKEAQRVMRITTESQRRYMDWQQQLHAATVESRAVQELIVEMFGDPEEAETVRVLNRIESTTETFKSKYLALEVARGGATAYSVLNALTGYADHAFRYIGEDARKAETRFASTVIGGRATAFKERASVLVSQLAGFPVK